MESGFFSFNGSHRSSTIFFLVIVGLVVPALGASAYHYRRTNFAPVQSMFIAPARVRVVPRPKLWDIWVKGVGADIWNDNNLPLSAHLDRAKKNLHEKERPALPPASAHRPADPWNQPQAVTVNVLILMPSQSRRIHSVTDNFDELNGYWIGTTKVLASRQQGSEGSGDDPPLL